MNKAELEQLSDPELSVEILKVMHNTNDVQVECNGVAFCADKDNCTVEFNINYWSDMGPLIDDLDISIVKDGSYSWATNNPQELYEPMGDKKHEVQITNEVKTLRAAAIVWLLMQEGV